MRKKVTLKDIAKLAGVSESTVSLVLNKREIRISTEKKEEILRIADDLRYRPNLLAKSLSSQKTYTIGLIIPDLSNPFFASLANHIEIILRSKGYLLFVANSNDELDMDKKLITRFQDYQVDALIYCPANESFSLSTKERAALTKFSVASVIVDRIFPDLEENQVCFDNEYGGYIASKYLLDSGCQSVAFVSGDLNNYNATQRFAGYKRALQEHNQDLNEKIIFSGNYRFEAGYNIDVNILQEEKVDGVFCSNDLMAFGLLRKLEENNFADEIRVVGYDSLFAKEIVPGYFKSVAQDTKLLAEQVCEQLLDQINDPNYKTTTILSPELI